MQQPNDTLDSSCSTGSWSGGQPLRPLTLPDVLLQLVMQCCDQSTRFALARCSRDTLRAASHVVAWKYLRPIPLSAVFASFHPEILNGLRRFAETDVYNIQGVADAVLQRMPHIRIIRFPKATSNKEINRVSALPCMAHVHTIHLEPQSKAPSIAFPASVHTVFVSGQCAPQRLESLASMPHLTHLDMRGMTQDPNRYAKTIRACVHLQTLGLIYGNTNTLDLFFSDRQLPQLQTLDLAAFSPRTAFPFACLMDHPTLRRVSFRNNYHPDAIADAWIQSLEGRDEHASPLGLNTIHFGGVIRGYYGSTMLLQLPHAHLERLLHLTPPHVHIELGIPSIPLDSMEEVTRAVWSPSEILPDPVRIDDIHARIRALWQPLVALDPARVTVA